MNEVLFLLEQLEEYYKMKFLSEADNCVVVPRKLLEPLVDDLGEITLQLEACVFLKSKSNNTRRFKI